MLGPTWADISNYTDRFAAQNYAKAGHRAIGVLATDGERFVSDKHAEQSAHAHEAGLHVVHYHFARPEDDPRAVGEAAHFYGAVKPHFVRGDRVVIDFERAHPEGPAALGRYGQQLDDRLLTISGHEAIGYSFWDFLLNAGRELRVNSGWWWVARYGARILWLPGGRKLWSQQYTDGIAGPEPHRFAGIGNCDGSRFTIRGWRDFTRRTRYGR